MKSDSRTKIDVRALIKFFGGPTAMRELWMRNGYILTKGSQDKWVMRDSFPTSRILEAADVARRIGVDFDIKAFIKTIRRRTE